jgi:3',5'-cyclic AMP phosphodiesterase CpdA
VAPVLGLAAGVALSGIGAVLVMVGLLSVWGTGPGSGASPVAEATSSPTSPGSSGSAGPSVAAPLPSPSGDPVLVGAGDIARCDGTDDEATAALLAGIAGQVFTLGDNAYDSGTPAEFSECYDPSWGQVKDRTLFPVPGNHDHATRDAAGYTGYFGSAAAPDGVTWYSRDVGTWHVIVLDASCDAVEGGCGPGSPELTWLRADLAASNARCTLAMWHQPRFSSGVHGNDPAVAPFWDALYAGGADLVLNGHDHDYERFAPQDPSGAADPARGITEIVVGTGGAALRTFGPAIANDVVRSNLAHGVLAVTLKPSGWSFRFVSTDGSFRDEGQGTCH